MRRLCCLTLIATAAFAADIGPSKGSLLIVGGGQLGPELVQRFIDLAGGKDAPMVFIPTAEETDPVHATVENNFLTKAGVTHVSILHTRDRKVADTDEFVKPLLEARAVWFEGGRQWRLVDSYLNTRTEKEVWNVLARGGVVGGSSAGATIQGSYLVRGAREGNTVMMAPGYEQGMGFLKQAAVDQHVITRHREDDLNSVIDRFPKLLGIGIDESTAIVVKGDQFEVIGKSKVFIHDAGYKPAADGKKWYTLAAGDRFDLKKRQKLPAAASN
jgi:cyanophycinase